MEEKMLKHLRMQALVLCLALLLAAPVAAKNVILMVSDGMGFSTVMATDSAATAATTMEMSRDRRTCFQTGCCMAG